MSTKDERFYQGGAIPVDNRPKKNIEGSPAFSGKNITFHPSKDSRKSLLDMFQDMFGTKQGSEYLTSLEREVAEGKRRQRNMIIGGIIILCAFFC
tara:strand:+ start:399 stop:683 length:285 start_codon:yes stop_codon:yes gene_type:complete